MMRGTAHAIIGGAAGAVLAALTHTPVVPLALIGALGGLLPDGDHPYSTLGRYIPWPTTERQGRGDFVAHGRRWFGGRTIWHRGETHSVGGASIAGIGAGGLTVVVSRWARGTARVAEALGRVGVHPHPWAWGGLAAAALGAGYLSHLLADTVNRSPQMLWWPFTRRMVHPPWRGVREASPAGQAIEWAAALVAAVGALLVVR